MKWVVNIVFYILQVGEHGRIENLFRYNYLTHNNLMSIETTLDYC